MRSNRYRRTVAFVLLGLTLAVSRGRTQSTPAAAARSITIGLHAPVDAALASFGPTPESRWAPHWAPRFLVTTGPSDDPDFAVFETGATDKPITWALTQYDRQNHRIQYVIALCHQHS